jgi:hypothetical protein
MGRLMTEKSLPFQRPHTSGHLVRLLTITDTNANEKRADRNFKISVCPLAILFQSIIP